ncbi:uncharacterized protein K452DRAFT_324024 [Aplosporella prunicola CBS 121167]|uniref:SWIRM domain-containing protein n=1 Tax=Aplosporella prunicola CBS 121167 TaxID=1176127 RepID=A0A6A6BRK1_9PEZI|nr:uncharacterized protein K452DRAFT_324024 [Aplosporella prunicola CBS 121167]KAF2145915.1 hypothetical protein K452DRAFT_324024 [Aplosporella prunicola CBS 121167]
MASHTTKTDSRFSLSTLLSPPEPSKPDSFSDDSPMAAQSAHFGARPASMFDSSSMKHFTSVHAPGSNMRSKGLPPSPPVSPFDNLHKESSVEDTSRDPPLFPDTASDKDGAALPLFPGGSAAADSTHDLAIKHHMAHPGWRKAMVRPTQDEYELALQCQSIAFHSVCEDQFKKDPHAYMRNERAYLDEVYRPKKNAGRAPLRTLAPAPAGVRKQKMVGARSPRGPRATKRTPKAIVLDSFEPKPATPKAPRVMAPKEDIDFDLLPDYSPPLSSLPEDGRKGLKADWKGTPVDLSSDPHRHLLHPSEVNVASILRLNCATYLSNKRRIFAARVKALIKGEDFNKTKAQQACKIDVNKASKLWAAYDRVGWFKPSLFTEYLDNFVDIPPN